MSSKQATEVYQLLCVVFPYYSVIEEHYVYYKGVRLFFDIYISELGILFEIQGRQHSEFIKHFHGDRDGFLSSKKRDNLKLEYVELYKIPLVVINYNEKMDEQVLLLRIHDAQKKVV